MFVVQVRFGLTPAALFLVSLVWKKVKTLNQKTTHPISTLFLKLADFYHGGLQLAMAMAMAMLEVKFTPQLHAASQVLKTGLLESTHIASALADSVHNLQTIGRRLPSLEAEALPVPNPIFLATGDQIDHAIGLAASLLNVYATVCELHDSLMPRSSLDLSAYLSVMKQLEEALAFLSDNSRLVFLWLKDTLEFFRDNHLSTERCAANATKSLTILQLLQSIEEHARFDGGFLSAALENLEFEFRRILTENSTPFPLPPASSSPQIEAFFDSSPLPVYIVRDLEKIVDRLNSNHRIQECISTYVEVRSLNARESFRAFDLHYLELSTVDICNSQSMEDVSSKWRTHFQSAVKHLLVPEFNLCKEILEKLGSNVETECFAEITVQSGFLSLLHFGKKIAQSKKDPVKLLKLLEMFMALNNLRVDMNRIFGGEECGDIRNLIRDLVKQVINGICEIFWELPDQVKRQRPSSPPADGGVPQLVGFVTGYCNQLLGDEYRPVLNQVLSIERSWRGEKEGDNLLPNQIYAIIKEVAGNLDHWSKSYADLCQSYYFMMNNHCHFSNMQGTKVGEMMGEAWMRANEEYKDYYAALYLRESWGKVVRLVGEKGCRERTDRVWLKRRLKDFNEAFSERYEKESKWVAADQRQREKLCQILVQGIVPVYRNYLKTYANEVQVEGNGSNKHVKYSAEKMEEMLGSLFKPKLIKKYGNGSSREVYFIRSRINFFNACFHL